MKVVILAGGMGTRLRKETELSAQIDGTDWGKADFLAHHENYAHYGYNDFVICLGHKGEIIRNYFLA